MGDQSVEVGHLTSTEKLEGCPNIVLSSAMMDVPMEIWRMYSPSRFLYYYHQTEEDSSSVTTSNALDTNRKRTWLFLCMHPYFWKFLHCILKTFTCP
jgi:hypothetical protein